MIALIDADSIIYMIAWNYRDLGTDDEVQASCGVFLRDILTLLGSDSYIGVFSPPSAVTFRNTTYKYAPYKGNRPEKPEFFTKWEEVVKNYFTDKYGFFTDPGLEADDVVASISIQYQVKGIGCVICSPDKDLLQIPGKHYDYKSTEPKTTWVASEEAHWFFWTQMLMGDEGDNVAGVPGLGEVKAKKIIADLKANGDILTTRFHIIQRYVKYFGAYYGTIIFKETERTLRLMTPLHDFYEEYREILEEYASTRIRKLEKPSGFFDVTG